jgi:hypothetical protein
MVAICVNDPTGSAIPVRTASTPAIIVVATAPIPTVRTPSFPFAASIGNAFFATFLPSICKMKNYCLQPNGLCFANLRLIAIDFVSKPAFFRQTA